MFPLPHLLPDLSLTPYTHTILCFSLSHKQPSPSPAHTKFCVGKLILSMRPALECGQYTQFHCIKDN